MAKRRRLRRKKSAAATPAPPVTFPTENDVLGFLDAWRALTAAAVHSKHAFDADHASVLLTTVKLLSPNSTAAQMVALEASLARKELSHQAEVGALMTFAKRIELVIGPLLKTLEAKVRPLLEARRASDQDDLKKAPLTVEGKEVMAEELELLDRLLDTNSLLAAAVLVPDASVSVKAKGRSR